MPVVSSPAPQPVAPRGLRRYLVALSLSALLPALLAAGYAVLAAGAAFREASSARLIDTSRALARAVELELRSSAVALETLAQTSLDHDHAPARQVARRYGAELIDATTASNPVQSPDKALSDSLALARATGRTAYSNLYQPAGAHQPVVTITALRETEGSAGNDTLTMQIPASQLVQTLRRVNSADPGVLVAVTDGKGRIVARSRDPDRFIGKPVPDWGTLQELGTDSGVFTAVTKEGSSVVFGFQKINGTPGWVTVVGEPLARFDARWIVPLERLGLGGLIAVVLTAVTATLIGRRILEPVDSLTRHAASVAANPGDSLCSQPPPARIAEFESLRRSLLASEHALRERIGSEARIAAQLARSERTYRALAGAGALVFWRCQAHGSLLSIAGWSSLTGQPDPQALGSGWLQRIHCDDRPVMQAAWTNATDRVGTVDVEVRLLVLDTSYRWVRVRGVPVDDDTAIVEWVGIIEDIDARRQAQNRIAHMAFHDALTGVGNRQYLLQRAGQLLEANGGAARPDAGESPDHPPIPGALLGLNIDRFKIINDSLGPAVGDGLLQSVARRLMQLVEDTDVVVRLNGDEFAILQTGGPQPESARRLATRLLDDLARPHDIEGRTVVVNTSIGIALLGDATDPDGLLRNANLAQHQAKRDHRGSFCFFEPAMNAQMQQRHQLEQDLRTAFAQRALEVWYQPQVKTATGELTGYEALLRWNHPVRGYVSPVEFIPVAEEIGLIIPLGEWVLLQGCHQAMSWPATVTLSVNVSPKQLASAALDRAVTEALGGSGLPSARLDLEITENALASDIEAAKAALTRLRQIGCGIVMDDFGTGNSSLNHLRTFPFSKVKIDRTFTSEIGSTPQSTAIIAAVTQLCSSLGTTVTAEGVETQAQRDYLIAVGCHDAQGYLFGRPMPASSLPHAAAPAAASREPAQTDDLKSRS